MRTKKFLLFFFLLTLTLSALGADPLKYAVQLNRSSYYDGAGGQSLWQSKLGVSVEPIQGEVLPRAYAYIGLFYPLSIGVSAALKSESPFSQASGFLKWTLFERWGFPALALRTSYNKYQSKQEGEISSLASGLAASWGYNILSAMASYELRRDQISWQLLDDMQLNRSDFYLVANYGLHVQLLPAELDFALLLSRARNDSILSSSFTYIL